MDNETSRVIGLIRDMALRGATEEELAVVTAYLIMIKNFDCDRYYELRGKVDNLAIKYQLGGDLDNADRGLQIEFAQI